MKTVSWTVAAPAALATAACLAAAAPGHPGEAPGDAGHRIDHVIVGVSDLDEGIATLERLTGVRPVFGGEHPGRGTHNALGLIRPERAERRTRAALPMQRIQATRGVASRQLSSDRMSAATA